jgi:hypothetical protein
VAVNDIANHFVRTYETHVIELVQQKKSLLRHTVTERSPGPTEKHSFRVVAARGAMTSRNTASGSTPGLVAFKRTATPFVDTQLNDRICGSEPFGTADSYTRAEMLRMLEDPQSVMLLAQSRQVARQFDDIIIAAFNATAYDTANNANAFAAGKIIGGAAVTPDFNLVKTARETVLEANVYKDEEVFLVCSPNFISCMMDETKYGSRDYVSAQAIQEGNAPVRWMGFSWIVSNRLQHPVLGPPNQTYAMIYTKDAIGLLLQEDIHVDVGQSPMNWFDWICQTSIDCGSVRIQDDKVWALQYLETN